VIGVKGGLWHAAHEGALDGELFASLLEKLMTQRRKAVHPIIDGFSAHRNAAVKDSVVGTEGKLTLHFLSEDASGTGPGRTGIARRPLRKGEKLGPKIREQIEQIQPTPNSSVHYSGILLSFIFLTYG
jgi:hypothetical protein